MKTHKDLDVWKESINLVEYIYRITSSYPKNETYGLISQMRRASISIPSNIAEGAGRKSSKEFARFISIAQGSLSELETQLIISVRLNYIQDYNENQIEVLQKLMNGLIRYLKQN